MVVGEQEFEFSIVHHPGRKHNNADALSRLPCRQCGRLAESTTNAVITSAEVCGGTHKQSCVTCSIREMLKAMEAH